jgi:SSS family solute:Na+ symporter
MDDRGGRPARHRCALLLSRYDIHSLFDVSIELAGLLGGGFAGAYTLGMFTRRANSPGVAIGVGTAIVLTTRLVDSSWCIPTSTWAISIMLCIVVGYLASLFPAPTRSLRGLTIYTGATSTWCASATTTPTTAAPSCSGRSATSCTRR